MGDKVLLGTFVRASYVPQRILRDIVENFGTDRIFIFSVDDDIHKRLITFNVNKDVLEDKFAKYKQTNKNTLRLHRHKESNTFYTINSLNKLVSRQNGNSGREYQVDWSGYDNSCVVLNNEGELKVLKTKLAKVVEY